MKIRSLLPLMACLAGIPALCAEPLPALSPSGSPVTFTLPGAVQFDFTARTNQLPYRVMVWAPTDAKTRAYPVIYLLDGNTWFPGAAAEGWHFNNAIIVGIGVPSDSVQEWRRRRTLDLTPTEDGRRTDVKTGGGLAFARVLLEEIKPFIETTYKVEAGQRTLYGLSLGGLMTAHVMLNRPQAFDTYVICSPILGWNNQAVLQAEAAFAERVRAGNLKLRVLVTAAADEAKSVIDGAAEFAGRLKAVPGVEAQYVLFANETHGSVSLATIGRALTFAIPKSATNPANR